MKKEKAIKLDYSNLGKCLEKMLEVDRNDWDIFHENFVKILVDFGYGYCLTVDEGKWLENVKNFWRRYKYYRLYKLLIN